jgi:hypothetical protein
MAAPLDSGDDDVAHDAPGTGTRVQVSNLHPAFPQFRRVLRSGGQDYLSGGSPYLVGSLEMRRT